MTTKYYYNCPIKAAYMAKEFGVKMYSPETEEYIEAELCISDYLWAASNPDDDMNYQPPFYIHPDSLEIFEPREGDIVEYSTYTLKDRWHTKFKRLSKRGGSLVRIIQRDNKPFIMPKHD